MTASSTSSSERGRRASSRHRRAAAAAAAAFGAFLAALPFARAALVEEEFRVIDTGLSADAAATLAAGRPLFAFVGTSQTRRSVDALSIEKRLFGDDPSTPFVANLGVDGVHVAMAPELLRRLAARGPLDTVVLELGHISNDQYRGVAYLRDFLADESVRDGFRGTPRGSRAVALWEEEHSRPWNGVARTARVVVDQRARVVLSEFGRAPMEASRGWGPSDMRRTREWVLDALGRADWIQGSDLLDACPQRAFLAAARICAEECRRRGARFAVLVQPVHRELAAEVPVLRHFERTAREETLPALRSAGIDVLDPPDRFWRGDLFSDSVHLHREGAGGFTDWVAERLAELRASR